MNTQTGNSERSETLPSDQVRAASAGRVVLAAKIMGGLTLLIGGAWWALMWTYVMTHNGTKNLDELLIPITAGLTCIVFMVPTAILTRAARSRGGDKLRFNRFALTLVGSLMTWTVIMGFLVYGN